MELTKPFEAKLNQWFDLFCNVSENLLRCGELLAEMIDENPETPEILLKKYPNLKWEMLEMLEQIGRKRLMPELLLDTSPGARRLANMSYEMQQALYLKPITIPVRQPDGEVFFKTKSIDKMSPAELPLVLGPKGELTNDEKKAALIEKEREKKRREMRYEVDGNTIKFIGECEFEINSLIAILQRIADKNKDSAIETLETDMKGNQGKVAA